MVALSCDLSRMHEVRRLADSVRQEHPDLDVVLNHAGAATFQRVITPEGFETAFAVNHLAPYLLTTSLLPILKGRPEARVVTVSSDNHTSVKNIPWDDLYAPADFRPLQNYDRTKLLNVWFTRALARRLEGGPVSAACVSPGFVRTNLARDATGAFAFFIRRIAPLFQSSPAKGADTPVYACTASELSGRNGIYLAGRKVREPGGLGTDDQAAERLWRLSEELVASSPNI